MIQTSSISLKGQGCNSKKLKKLNKDFYISLIIQVSKNSQNSYDGVLHIFVRRQKTKRFFSFGDYQRFNYQAKFQHSFSGTMVRSPMGLTSANESQRLSSSSLMFFKRHLKTKIAIKLLNYSLHLYIQKLHHQRTF